MRLVTVKMPEIYVRGIEELVRAGRYSSRSEVIRIAVRELLMRELWGQQRAPIAALARLDIEAPFSFAEDEGVSDIV